MSNLDYLQKCTAVTGVCYDMADCGAVRNVVPGLVHCRSLQQVLTEIAKQRPAFVLVHVSDETDLVLDQVPRIRRHLRGELIVAADTVTMPLVRRVAAMDVHRLVECRPDEIAAAVRRVGTSAQQHDPFGALVFQSNVMKEVVSDAQAVAAGSYPVLVTGETGTGKDLIARAVHAAAGRTGAFVAENVAGLDDTLFSDSLFGHEKGAYTGASHRRRGKVRTAAEGTLFLDEIGDLSPRSQIKLLRLLERGEFYPLGATQPHHVNVRFVLATNRDLRELVRTGAFRKDLYYRVAYHTLHLPPLDQRQGDIPALVRHFVREAVIRLGRPVMSVPEETMEILCARDYPGNVRELRSRVVNAVMLCPGTQLLPKYLGDPIQLFQELLTAEMEPSVPQPDQLTFPRRLPGVTAITIQLVEEALRRTDGNQSKAARLLGVTPSAVNKRLQLNSSGA